MLAPSHPCCTAGTRGWCEDGRVPSLRAALCPAPCLHGQGGERAVQGRGLASLPVAPRRLGRPRHSPALSSRFRRVSAGPRRRCPLLSASPAQPTPPRSSRAWRGCSACGGPQEGRLPRRGCTRSPLVSALGFGKGISAGANPSRSPAVKGRKLHYESFQNELYYGAAPHRFPQGARSFLTMRLSCCPSNAAVDPRGAERQGRYPWGRQWGCVGELVSKAVSPGVCQASRRGPGGRAHSVPAGRCAV